ARAADDALRDRAGGRGAGGAAEPGGRRAAVRREHARAAARVPGDDRRRGVPGARRPAARHAEVVRPAAKAFGTARVSVWLTVFIPKDERLPHPSRERSRRSSGRPSSPAFASLTGVPIAWRDQMGRAFRAGESSTRSREPRNSERGLYGRQPRG